MNLNSNILFLDSIKTNIYGNKCYGGIYVRNLQDHEAAMVLALWESLRDSETHM